jgi:hypothetical protein
VRDIIIKNNKREIVMYRLTKQKILNQIAALASSDDEPDERQVKSLASLLPGATGDVLINKLESISLVTGKYRDFDDVMDEAQEHIDAVINYVSTVNEKYLIEEHSGFGEATESGLAMKKCSALKVRDQAIEFYKDIGFKTLDRKISFILPDDAVGVSHRLIEDAMNTYSIMEQFVDIRVSNEGRKVEIWTPGLYDNYAIGQIFNLQQSGEFDSRAKLSVESIASTIPGCKDWIDMEHKAELRKEIDSIKEVDRRSLRDCSL